MSHGERDFSDQRIKHLEMIQGVITRMADSSAWMKRLAVIIVGGTMALAARADEGFWLLPVTAGFIILALWGMDARYLQQERWFRSLYDEVRREEPGWWPDFRLTPTPSLMASTKFTDTLFSWSTVTFYALLIAGLLATGLQLR